MDTLADLGVRRNVPLAAFTTFGIGGEAEYFACPTSRDDLAQVLRNASLSQLPIRILGGGSNLLIDDKSLRGVVIRLDSHQFKDVCVSSEVVSVGAGVELTKLAKIALRSGLSGLENFAGIPGTIGAAVVGNSGQKRASIGQHVREVRGYRLDGSAIQLARPDLIFGYRESNLDSIVVTDVDLELRKTNYSSELLRTYFEIASSKTQTQPYGLRNAGCYFKNPEGDSAGRLIDAAGLKGLCVGGAQICCKHANFIVNKNYSTYDDVINLARLVKQKVLAHFDVELEEEVRVWSSRHG